MSDTPEHELLIGEADGIHVSVARGLGTAAGRTLSPKLFREALGSLLRGK